MRILLADNDRRVCSALHLLLKSDRNLNVIGESADVTSLISQIEELKPDLVLLDWELPGKPDAVLIRGLHRLDATLKIIALSSRPEVEQEALCASADYFVSKVDPPESLLTVLTGLVEHHQAISTDK
jgi:two-component system response regulator DesR